jgi:uncharacterized protein YqjF (DUF2071 family)
MTATAPTTFVAPAIDRLTPEARPDRSHLVAERWQSVLFLHWALPKEAVQRHLPKRLTADTFDGLGWISAMLFTVTKARVRPLPPVPGLSRFHQAVLHTHVHLDGMDPGVWFYSLDAGNPVALALGRLLQLPWFPARVKRALKGDEQRFESSRLDVRKAKRASINAAWRSTGALIEAPHGSREHFLTQRFFRYSPAMAGRLWKRQLHHAPWPLFPAELRTLEQTIDEAQGLPFLSKRPLVHWSPGVDVELFSPRLV